jgi:hypothetical protein
MENNLLYEMSEADQKKNTWATLAIMFFLLLVVVIVAVFLFSSRKQSNVSMVDTQNQQLLRQKKQALDVLYDKESAPLTTESSTSSPDLLNEKSGEFGISGALVFSGIQSNRASDVGVRIHAVSISDPFAKPTVLYPQYQVSGMAEFIDPQNPKELFFLGLSQQSVRVEPDKYGIHYLSSATGTLISSKAATGVAERNLAWSNESQLLAFDRKKGETKDYKDRILIDNWEIVIVDPKTSKVVVEIDQATQLQWAPDGEKALLLKDDGLYLFTLETKELEKIISIPDQGTVLSTSMIDVTSDGKYLAWTTAKRGIITMYEIVTWDGIEIRELGRISEKDTEFYWPVFSPLGDYYAVQAIDSDMGGTKTRKNARLEIRSTKGRDVLRTYPLNDFDFNQLFTDGWLAKMPVLPN